jgi:hypothetical protein
MKKTKQTKLHTKVKPIKTQQDRHDIVVKLKEKFHNITGIDLDTFEAPGIVEFKKILDEYATVTNLTGGFSGKIFVQEIGRYIEYILPVRASTPEHVALVVA